MTASAGPLRHEREEAAGIVEGELGDRVLFSPGVSHLWHEHHKRRPKPDAGIGFELYPFGKDRREDTVVFYAPRGQPLALVGLPRHRRADLAERAPPLRRRVADEPFRDLVLRLPGDLRRIIPLRPVSVGENDVDARALGHDSDFLDVLAEILR